MAGDLEEFLKRAAERRAAKQGGGGGGRPAARPQPARPEPPQQAEVIEPLRERHIRPSLDEPIPVAEVVEEPISPLAEQQRRLEESRKQAAEARDRLAAQRRKSSDPEPGPDMSMPTGSAAEDLIELLKRPEGLRQAFLLREILERPKFND